MASIQASTDTFLNKNSMGRWADKLARQADGAIDDMVRQGKAEAVTLAPVGEHGGKPRAGHVHFKDSIVDVEFSGGQEKGWGTKSDHFWWYVRGTKPHRITGKMNFWWSNTGEWFIWNNPLFGPDGKTGFSNWNPLQGARIWHPGNGPHPNWLEESFRRVAAMAPTYLKRRVG